jgi:hypothetical protein
VNQKVQETVGTLNLKIARLNHRLRVLEQDRAMSRLYPAYQANLIQEYLQLQLQLHKLIHSRQEIL